MVRRPRSAPRIDPQYCRKRYTKPRKIMALGGITADGSKFFTFLKTGKMMNSVLYCKLLNKHIKKIVKTKNLMI